MSAQPRDQIVVFWILSDSACAECGEELGKGRFLRLEVDRPLCLGCADLDHLVFLGRGDVALTRRATRYSTVWAVVVRFSRSRKRYERQGVLVEEEALARAEQDVPRVLVADMRPHGQFDGKNDSNNGASRPRGRQRAAHSANVRGDRP